MELVKELRIGNLVKWGKSDENIARVQGMHCSSYDHMPSSWYVDYTVLSTKGRHYTAEMEDFQPLPLTESFLEAFGFKKDETGYVSEALSLNQYDTIFYLRIPSGTGYGREIKYVHQLQNLYFTITGKELEIEEAPGAA